MVKTFTLTDQKYMHKAIELAMLAQGRTSPNPLVGCVIVRDGVVVGEGYHHQAGTPHAEVHALHAAGENAKGSDVYVTLEPCSHYGKTPPCVDTLIQAQVKRVVAAMEDPNPLVSGNGFRKLHEAGIQVEVGLLQEKAKEINRPFLKAVTKKLPYVLYKSGVTLDGKTSVESGDSKWITSEGSRRYAHELRNRYDVIMVGSKTILMDDPLLTCRIDGGRDPVRIVLDGLLSLPLDAKVFDSSAAPCIVATTLSADSQKLALLKNKDNVEIWQYPTARNIPLQLLMQDIARRGYNSVLLEGGGMLAGKMLEEKLIDEIAFIFAPKLAGSGSSPLSGMKLSKMADAIQLRDVQVVELSGDIKISGMIDYSNEKPKLE